MVEGSHGPANPELPRDSRLKEGWRAAAAAYRSLYGKPPASPHRGCADEAMNAATAALKEVLPDLSDHDAMLQAVAAVYYASWAHPKWLYALYTPESRR